MQNKIIEYQNYMILSSILLGRKLYKCMCKSTTNEFLHLMFFIIFKQICDLESEFNSPNKKKNYQNYETNM